jgi:hypothetical protein
MNNIVQLVAAVLVLWIALTGVVWVVRGPNGALALNRWAGRSLVRLARVMIGNLLTGIGNLIIWLGTQIRGH